MVECQITVRLTPRGGRDQVDGWDGDVLRVRVAAPPAEGKANEALVRLLAKALGVPKSAVRIVGGQTAREKRVRVDGLDAASVRRRLG